MTVRNLIAGSSRHRSTLLLRPIRPEDEPMLIAAFHKLSLEAVRLRFFAPIKELTHATAAGLTQIDYDREMALVLADHDRSGAAELYAVARFSTDPDQERAEFALTVRDDVTGRGFGPLLLRRLIDYARERGHRRDLWPRPAREPKHAGDLPVDRVRGHGRSGRSGGQARAAAAVSRRSPEATGGKACNDRGARQRHAA
jgi:GNAT superfamily N-acetyltransferase